MFFALRELVQYSSWTPGKTDSGLCRDAGWEGIITVDCSPMARSVLGGLTLAEDSFDRSLDAGAIPQKIHRASAKTLKFRPALAT